MQEAVGDSVEDDRVWDIDVDYLHKEGVWFLSIIFVDWARKSKRGEGNLQN